MEVFNTEWFSSANFLKFFMYFSDCRVVKQHDHLVARQMDLDLNGVLQFLFLSFVSRPPWPIVALAVNQCQNLAYALDTSLAFTSDPVWLSL